MSVPPLFARCSWILLLTAAIGVSSCLAQWRDVRSRIDLHGGNATQLSEWQRLAGPVAGDLVTMKHTRWGDWYAAGNGGIHVSHDDGMTWQLFSLLPIRFNSFHDCIPVTPDVMLVGTDRGAFRTQDRGASWEALPKNLHSMAMDSSGIVCAIIDMAVYISPDTGRSWMGPTLPAAAVFKNIVYQLHVPSVGVLLACSRSTLYRSTDVGMSWDSLRFPFADMLGYDGGMLFGDATNLCLAVLPSYSNLILVYSTRDLGETWTQMYLPVEWDGLIQGIDARGEDVVFAERRNASCTARLHSSTDGGRSWTDCPFPFFRANAVFIRPDRDCFVSSWEQLYRVPGGGSSAIDVRAGLTNSTVRGLAALSDSLLLALMFSEVQRSTDAGVTWKVCKRFNECRMMAEEIDRMSDGSLLIIGIEESYAPTLYRSTDRGATWRPHTLPHADAQPWVLATGGASTVLAGYYDGALYVSDDTLATWKPLTAPKAATIERSALIDSAGRIFICQEGVLYYTDDREHWLLPIAGAPMPFRVEQLVEDGSGRIFATTTSDSVYRSTDHGESWTEAGKGMLARGSLDLVADGRGAVYISDDESTYRLQPGEERWKRIAQRGIPIANRSFAVSPTGRLFAGTQSFGVWTLLPPPPDPPAVAYGFVLHPPYPQPAAGPITLPFDADGTLAVTLDVYDVLGRRVHSARKWCSSAGRYEFTWDAASNMIAAGVYFYSITNIDRVLYGVVVRM